MKLVKTLEAIRRKPLGVKGFSAAGSDVGQSSSSVQSSAVKGLVTGRKAKVLDGMELMATGVMLTTSLYYNAAGDMIQEVGDIYTGGTAGTYRRSTLYRHQGEVAVTKESQTIGSATTTVLRKYSYDNAGRLTQILQGIDGGTPTLLETDTWDGVGRQATKVLGTGTQTVNYAWDIRDRLTGINKPSSLGTDKFGISYTYESGTTPQYGGNISGASWMHTGGSTQTYAYTYDIYGRLTAGTHSGGNSETAAYDPNGNLTSLTRTGTRAETLVYTYTSGTNKLGTLKSNGTNKTYAYNADGTMKTDGLRGLTVTYNALKLPKTVASGTTSTVTYIYDAAGNKLAVSQDGTVKNYYCGDFVCTSGLSVDYILTPNGQMTRNPSTGSYTAQYNITDHLGNVRSVVNSSGTVLQSTDYYPFGLAFSDANVTNNRYLYNGKELETYTIGSSYLGTLDYGARHYDARIGRWMVPDPLAEKNYGLSSYVYCTDNPVILIDPDGREGIKYIDNKGVKTIESNIVIILQPMLPVPENASSRARQRIERKNSSIAFENTESLRKAKESLENIYNGDKGGSLNSSGELVHFVFNIIGKEIDNTTTMDKTIALENGIEAVGEFGENTIARAVVVHEDFLRNGIWGVHKGYSITITPNAPHVTLPHEVGHSLGLHDDKSLGGLMSNPPSYGPSTKEVDRIWEMAKNKR